LEANRYHRQVLLPQVGPAGQERLAFSRVLIAGCGALGTVTAEQLARAGVGSLRIVDRDVVEWTNLQRQTLFVE
jgi:adenylyltransferase/sulfurtransferase